MQASRVTGPQVLSQRWFASSSSYHFDLHAGKDKFLGVLAAPLIIYVWGENKVSVSGYIIAYNVCVEGFKSLSGSIPLILAFVLHDRSSALTTISWRSTMWTSFTLTTLSVFCFWEKAILTSKEVRYNCFWVNVADSVWLSSRRKKGQFWTLCDFTELDPCMHKFKIYINLPHHSRAHTPTHTRTHTHTPLLLLLLSKRCVCVCVCVCVSASPSASVSAFASAFTFAAAFEKRQEVSEGNRGEDQGHITRHTTHTHIHRHTRLVFCVPCCWALVVLIVLSLFWSWRGFSGHFCDIHHLPNIAPFFRKSCDSVLIFWDNTHDQFY